MYKQKTARKFFAATSLTLLAPTLVAKKLPTGPYAGVNIGVVSNDTRVETKEVNGESKGAYKLAATSVAPGATIGYMVEKAGVRYGFEIGGYWANAKGNLMAFEKGLNVSTSSDWGAQVLARVGYLMNKGLSLYILGGAVYAQHSLNLSDSSNDQQVGSTKKNQVGWTAGVGLEGMVDEKSTFDVRYNYTQNKDIKANVYDKSVSGSLEDQIVAKGQSKAKVHKFTASYNLFL